MSQENQEIEFAPDTQEAAPALVTQPALETKGNTYKMIAFSVVFVAFGLFMLLDPHLMDGASAEGRNAFFKTFLIVVWSLPGSVIAIAIGGFLGYRVFASIRCIVSVATPSLAPSSGPSKPGFKASAFSFKAGNSSQAFSDKVAPSRRELEARSAKRKEHRAKGQG